MAITAQAVSELRRQTNAGMMACKKALTETNGDFDAAAKLLREKGEIKGRERADRETTEGIVATTLAADTNSGILAVVNCETDFVAKNEAFQAWVAELLLAISKNGATTTEEALAVPFADGTVENALGAKFIELGEVIKISRFARFEVSGNGSVASYIHMGGKVGVLLEVACDNADTTGKDEFATLLKDITLHIAAASPSGLSRDDIDGSVVEEENDINRKILLAEGKPEAMIEKILVGKINKFYSEQVLTEQSFVKDPDITIAKLLLAKGKDLGDTLTIKRFERFSI